MNGYTLTITLEQRVKNLIEQIPQEYRARATRECYGTDDYDFERNLTAYVLWRKWELYDHPVNEAEIFTDGFCDEQLTEYFGKVKVTTSKDWNKRHLYATREEQAGAADRRKAAFKKEFDDSDFPRWEMDEYGSLE